MADAEKKPVETGQQPPVMAQTMAAQQSTTVDDDSDPDFDDLDGEISGSLSALTAN